MPSYESHVEEPPAFRSGAVDPFPAWTTERQVPLSTEEIEDTLWDLQTKFGFQRESMRNIVRTTDLLGMLRAYYTPVVLLV